MSRVGTFQQIVNSRRTDFPAHELGTQIVDEYSRLWTYVEFAEAVVQGNAVQGTLQHDLINTLTGAINSKQIDDSGLPFTVEVRDKNGKVTTKAVPRIGSKIHIYAGTGDQAQGRVDGVIDTGSLAVYMLTDADGELTVALDNTSDMRVETPGLVRKAGTGLATHGHLPCTGVVQRRQGFASGDYGFVLSRGRGLALVGAGAVLGASVGIGTTVGVLLPLYFKGTATWDPASIADGDEEVKEITVTGAVLGDFVQVAFSLDVEDLQLSGQVTAADTVTASLLNNIGGAKDLAEGTVTALVTSSRITTHPPVGQIRSTGTSGELMEVDLNCLGGGHGNMFI